MELPVVLYTITYNTLRYRDRDKRSNCAHDKKKYLDIYLSISCFSPLQIQTIIRSSYTTSNMV